MIVTGAPGRPSVSARFTGGAAGPGIVLGCADGFGFLFPEYVCAPGGAPGPLALAPALAPPAAEETRSGAGPPERATATTASAPRIASAATSPAITRARQENLPPPGWPLRRLPSPAVLRSHGMPFLPCPARPLRLISREADAPAAGAGSGGVGNLAKPERTATCLLPGAVNPAGGRAAAPRPGRLACAGSYRVSASVIQIAAKDAAIIPNSRWAVANTQGVKACAAAASMARQIPYCITAHRPAANSIPPAITSERAAGSRYAAAAIRVPNSIAIIMCTAMPMTSAGPLNVPSSGAPRQNVCAIRFSGVQNPLPASHSIIIEKTAITAPPATPPAIPARRIFAFIRPPTLLLAEKAYQ